jgi:hypothetical protein
MKNFREYLAESERTYRYRVKIVGETGADLLKSFKQKLDQFDVVSVSDTRTTPVQAQPADFPGFPNQRVTTVDYEFRYPAIEPQIKQLAQLMGIDPNRIIMQTPAYDDNNQQQREQIADQNQDLLANSDYPNPDSQQKALSKDYAAAPDDHAVLKNAYRSDFSIAGGKTPKAKTTNDIPQDNTSPVSKTKRPPKPATGARPQG